MIIKSLSRSFTRAVLNHGWTADKPDWEKEVVVVTGGSAGIGKELVEILAGKSDKVAVLDIAEPTYAASESVRVRRERELNVPYAQRMRTSTAVISRAPKP